MKVRTSSIDQVHQHRDCHNVDGVSDKGVTGLWKSYGRLASSQRTKNHYPSKSTHFSDFSSNNLWLLCFSFFAVYLLEPMDATPLFDSS